MRPTGTRRRGESLFVVVLVVVLMVVILSICVWGVRDTHIQNCNRRDAQRFVRETAYRDACTENSEWPAGQIKTEPIETDPYGNAYKRIVAATETDVLAIVVSAGYDGHFDTTDDICCWRTGRRPAPSAEKKAGDGQDLHGFALGD